MQPSSLTFSEILRLRGGSTRGESESEDEDDSTSSVLAAAPTVDLIGTVQQQMEERTLPYDNGNTYTSTRSEKKSFGMIKRRTEREDEDEWNATSKPLRSSSPPKFEEVAPPFADHGDFNNNASSFASSLSDTLLESLLCSAEWGTSSSCDATIDDSNVGVVADQCREENKRDCDSSDLGVLLAAMGMATATPPATMAKGTGHVPPTNLADDVRYTVEELVPTVDADEGLSKKQQSTTDDVSDAAVCETGGHKTVPFDAIAVDRGETGAYLPFSSSSAAASLATTSSSTSTSSSPRSSSSCSSSSSDSESDIDCDGGESAAAATFKKASLPNNTSSAAPPSLDRLVLPVVQSSSSSTRSSLSLFSTHVAKCATRMKTLAAAREEIISKAVETALLELGVGSVLLSTMRTQTQKLLSIPELSALLGSKRLRTAKLRPHHVALAHRCWQEKGRGAQERGLTHTVRSLLHQARDIGNGPSSPSHEKVTSDKNTTNGPSLVSSTSAPSAIMTVHSWTVAVLKLMVDILVVSLISPSSSSSAAARNSNSNTTTEEASAASDKRAEFVLSRLQSTLNSWAGGSDSEEDDDDSDNDANESRPTLLSVSSARANVDSQNVTLSDRYRDLIEGKEGVAPRFGNNGRKVMADADGRRFDLSHLASALKVMREDTTSSSSSSSSEDEDENDEERGRATTASQSYNPLSIDNDGLGLMGMTAGGGSRGAKANLLSTRRLVPFVMGCTAPPLVERANDRTQVTSKGNALANATPVGGANAGRGRNSNGFEWMWDVSAYTSEEVTGLVRKLMAFSRGQQQGQGLHSASGPFSSTSSPSSSPLQMLSRANKWFTSQPPSMARVAGHVLRALLRDGTEELRDSVRRLRKKTRQHVKNERANNKTPTGPIDGAAPAASRGAFIADGGYAGRDSGAASLEEMAAKSVSLPSLAGGHLHARVVRGLAALAIKRIDRAREPQQTILSIGGKRPRNEETAGEASEERGTRGDAYLSCEIATSNNRVREGSRRTAAVPAQHLRNVGSLTYTGRLCWDGPQDGLPTSIRLWGAEGAVVPLTLLLPKSQ